MKLDRQDKREIIENAVTWITSMGMLVYGVAKVAQFKGASAITKTIPEMTGMELMWAFYGYSQPFVWVLGVIEVSAGILLLIPKTRLIGCLVATTILSNIILQDIFYEVNQGALMAAMIYQLMVLIVCWMRREQIKQALIALVQIKAKFFQFNQKFLIKFAIAFFLFALLRIAEFLLTTGRLFQL